MAYMRYSITPIALGINTSSPELFTNQVYSPRVVNGRIDQNSFIKRWGYLLDKTLPGPVYNIVLFALPDGTRHTLYLTDTELLKRESTGNFSFKTEMVTSGHVESITTTAVTGHLTSWNTDGIAAGDQFIMDADLTGSGVTETDANWRTISTVGGATSITLSASYAPGTMTGGAYRIRKVYTVPTNERWSWAIVNDKFCFTNGNTNMQYWSGSNYAATLDATPSIINARYCTEFANRLFVADLQITGARSPLTIKWSKEGDPTNWIDSTSGENDFLETDDVITGLGRVGTYLVVYKRDSIITGSRSGDPLAPVIYQAPRRGVGLVAPWSLVDFMGTNAWLGRDDFYTLNGDSPTSIGGPIRDKFLKEVGGTEIEKVFGFANYNANEIYWMANTDTGQRAYVWNYKTNQWTTNEYPLQVHGFGRGAV
jgi:hypothetical protein